MPTKPYQQHLIIALCIASVCVTNTRVTAKQLGADPYSVSWTVDQNQYRCTLEQTIPEFGKILFSQRPDAEIALEIHALASLYRGKPSKLKASAPTWRADMPGFLISSSSKVDEPSKKATFNTADSKMAYKALKDGYRLQLAITHGSPPENIQISIEGLGFSPLLSEFDQCKKQSQQLLVADNERLEMEKKAADELALTMAKLEAISPKTAALTAGEIDARTATPLQQAIEDLPDYYRIPFDYGDTEITDTSAQSLDQLVRRWSLIGMPPEVVLHGHANDADSTGSYINSDLRAQSIVRYLIAKMPELKLRIEAHGDTMPIEKVSSQRVDIVPSDLPDWE